MKDVLRHHLQTLNLYNMSNGFTILNLSVYFNFRKFLTHFGNFFYLDRNSIFYIYLYFCFYTNIIVYSLMTYIAILCISSNKIYKGYLIHNHKRKDVLNTIYL